MMIQKKLGQAKITPTCVNILFCIVGMRHFYPNLWALISFLYFYFFKKLILLMCLCSVFQLDSGLPLRFWGIRFWGVSEIF